MRNEDKIKIGLLNKLSAFMGGMKEQSKNLSGGDVYELVNFQLERMYRGITGKMPLPVKKG